MKFCYYSRDYAIGIFMAEKDVNSHDNTMVFFYGRQKCTQVLIDDWEVNSGDLAIGIIIYRIRW